jgi:2-keto-4-pentenoate hydratase
MIEAIAARLRQAELTRTPIAPIRTELGEKDIPAAYAIQGVNTRLRLAAGGKLRGRKVGLTSAAVQRQLGVDQPDIGMLFADMEIADGGTGGLATLIQPKIESEVAFVLARDLTRKGMTLDDVLKATDYVIPCLEIVDSRIADWKIGIVDTVADNASSARFVLGTTPRRPADVEFINCEMVLLEDGASRTTGKGAASLGNPVEAVRWLAEATADTDYPLRAGDVVLSGALGPMAPIKPGAHYVATIGGLGSVSARFA